MKYLELFCKFIKGLPDFKNSIEPFAKNANISGEEAIVLLSVFYNESYEISFNDNIRNQLIEKKLLEYNDKRLSLTGKGSIIAKSIISNLNRL